MTELLMALKPNPSQAQQWRNETILAQGCWVGIVHPGEDRILPMRLWLSLRRTNFDLLEFNDLTFTAPNAAEFEGLAFFMNQSDATPLFAFVFDDGTKFVTAGSTFTVSNTRINITGGEA